MTNPGFPKEKAPQLLVSVRSAQEAQAAFEGGAHIIDIKEPQNGSLGKADDPTIQEIVQTVRSLDEDCPLSVALGELHDWQATQAMPQLPAGVSYVKLGFSGCRLIGNWRDRWREFRRRLLEEAPTLPDWVAVVYADWQSADSPSPRDILKTATELPCAAVLLDTFHKNGRSLVDVLSSTDLISFAEDVHRIGLPLAVAGSLRVDDLPKLNPVTPQIIAIRSAACLNGERGGPVCMSAVQNFREHLVHATSPQLPRST